MDFPIRGRKVHTGQLLLLKTKFFNNNFSPNRFTEELIPNLLFQKLWHVFLCASAKSLPFLTAVKLWKHCKSEITIDLRNGRRDAPVGVWWCHGMRHRQTQSFLAGCLETPPILSIYHLGVTFSTINLSTWNLANNLKLRRRETLLIQAAKYPNLP